MLNFDKDIKPILDRHEIPVEEKTSFRKCAANKKAIYVSNTKRGVTRIDFSGFEVPELDHEPDGFRRLSPEEAKELKLGKVRGQLLLANAEITKEEALDLLEVAAATVANTEITGFKAEPKKAKQEEPEEQPTEESSSDDEEEVTEEGQEYEVAYEEEDSLEQ